MSQEHSVNHNKATAAGLLVALGIIYGDIGTSPLYVLKSIIGDEAINADIVLGGISAIFWTLTLITTIKYVTLLLRADNDGEGGILPLYVLIKKMKVKWLIVPAIIGASTLLADGIITPPISVASAIEGIKALPQFSHLNPIPFVLLILVGIFFFQQFGTDKVGKSFGPVMVTWFTVIGILGVINLWNDWSVLKALNPYYAYNLITNHPNGFWLLGAIFLCSTGAEALYHDLGHCGRQNIRISWGYVKTCLILNYFGQGAWLMSHLGTKLNGANPFYSIMPSWFLGFGIILATIAAIVASQALISGSFSLINEAIRLNFWPKVKIIYPTNMKGQLYIPSTNWFLLFGCLSVVFYFRESSNMEAAYGMAIVITMFMTSILLVYYMIMKKFPIVVIGLFTIVYLVVELSFVIANSAKFIHGGWVTLLISGLYITIITVWHKARLIKEKYLEFTKFRNHIETLVALSEDESVPKYASNLVFLTSSARVDEIETKIIYSIIQKQPKRADKYWFIHVNVLNEPYKMEYKVTEMRQGKIYRIDYNLGFRVEPKINLLFRKVVEDMVKNNEVDIKSTYTSLRKFNIIGDFKFVVIEKYVSIDNDFPIWDRFVLAVYSWIKKISLSEEKAFGLDTSSVIIEKVPLIISPASGIRMNRIFDQVEEG